MPLPGLGAAWQPAVQPAAMWTRTVLRNHNVLCLINSEMSALFWSYVSFLWLSVYFTNHHCLWSWKFLRHFFQLFLAADFLLLQTVVCCSSCYLTSPIAADETESISAFLHSCEISTSLTSLVFPDTGHKYSTNISSFRVPWLASQPASPLHL